MTTLSRRALALSSSSFSSSFAWRPQRTSDGTETVGGGTVVISLLAGMLNAVAGTVLWSRVPSRR